MSNFTQVYENLNPNQRQAVDVIDGPLLVIAGPGTGKTQLLTARVANILTKTDTLPQNILCLTFTESGATNMRERLSSFIGQAAYDVQISTYHAFGGDLIQKYPEYFTGLQLLNPIDSLSQYQILNAIVEKMSYRNPLKQTQHHINDLISTISEIKRALLTPDELRSIAEQNTEFITNASVCSSKLFSGLKSTASYKTVFPLFSQLCEELEAIQASQSIAARFSNLKQLAIQELRDALTIAEENQKTKSITAWKNNWLIKDNSNAYIFDGVLANQRILALADVYETYSAMLMRQNVYDFDDMILRSIDALQVHQDFKFTLQERYQYVLLDEYQDTNAAQAKLIQLLTDNPVNEGRPNVMAVGDDDQAIYAFQGAKYSNMLDFYTQYNDAAVINLTQNYRSHSDILHVAHTVANQITERLHHNFGSMSKTLTAYDTVTDAVLSRRDFMSDVAQSYWIAERISQLISDGVNPNEIAILAPRHKYLEPLVGYLNKLSVPVQYEKRENILETSVIQQILQILRLLNALHEKNLSMAESLWPQVLSYDFFGVPTSTIWELSWQVNDDKSTWAQVALDHPATRPATLLLLSLASRVESDTCETILDYILGTTPVSTNELDDPHITSPLKSYYLSETIRSFQPELFYETLSHLTVLREKLRERRYLQKGPLFIKDLLDLVDLYEAAGQRMIDASPYSQSTNAVQLMTVYKSKGLEFEHVFLVNCHDDVWGSSSRTSANRITLPVNLRPIRKSGTTDDERLRILFVAVTRAKQGLYMTGFRRTFAGSQTRALKYFDEQDQQDGTRRAMILPELYQNVINDDVERPALETFTTNWKERHKDIVPDVKLQHLLEARIAKYQLSPTHLNQFSDVIYGGPQQFFFNSILRFPQAQTVSSIYGNVMHETLEWIQLQFNATGNMPTLTAIVLSFESYLKRTDLTKDQYDLEFERGQYALESYLAQRTEMFKIHNIPEYNFRNEGVFVGEVHLGGKVDLLEIDHKSKRICVVDYKTGSWYAKWKNDAKLHKYKQQLLVYKLLVEGSNKFKGYTVNEGRLEFIEPDGQGNVYALDLDLTNVDDEIQRLKKLLSAMWSHVKTLQMPSVEQYSKDLKGIKAFEDDLIREA